MKKCIVLFSLILITISVTLFSAAQKEVQENGKAEIQTDSIENSSPSNKSTSLYGAMAVESLDEFTLEEMLRYSIEDERMALAEYELIMSKFNISKPFSNIIEAEKTHERYLLDLYQKYGFTVPSFIGSEHTIIPETLNETFDIGIKAEIANIAMYEKFLTYDLYDDVREVFIVLRDGSLKHLEAFKRQASKY